MAGKWSTAHGGQKYETSVMTEQHSKDAQLTAQPVAPELGTRFICRQQHPDSAFGGGCSPDGRTRRAESGAAGALRGTQPDARKIRPRAGGRGLGQGGEVGSGGRETRTSDRRGLQGLRHLPSVTSCTAVRCSRAGTARPSHTGLSPARPAVFNAQHKPITPSTPAGSSPGAAHERTARHDIHRASRSPEY